MKKAEADLVKEYGALNAAERYVAWVAIQKGFDATLRTMPADASMEDAADAAWAFALRSGIEAAKSTVAVSSGLLEAIGEAQAKEGGVVNVRILVSGEIARMDNGNVIAKNMLELLSKCDVALEAAQRARDEALKEREEIARRRNELSKGASHMAISLVQALKQKNMDGFMQSTLECGVLNAPPLDVHAASPCPLCGAVPKDHAENKRILDMGGCVTGSWVCDHKAMREWAKA